jgi:integrase
MRTTSRAKITKRVVDALRQDPNKDLFLWDTEIRGFGVRLKPSGKGAFFIQYRNLEGRTRRLAVGKLGTETPDQARSTAKQKLAEVGRGQDPSAERHKTRTEITVVELAELWLKEGCARKKASTIAMDRSRIDRHVKPLLGMRSVAALTRADLEIFQLEVAEGKSAKRVRSKGRGRPLVTGGKAVAARTLGMLSSMLEFAVRRQIRPNNPARGIHKYPDKRRRRFLSLGELENLGKALCEAEIAGVSLNPIHAIRLLLLTGCRRNEILALPWHWVDLKGRCIRFGDTKSGAQIRPIGSAAIEYLRGMARTSDWVLPSTVGTGHYVALPRALADFCNRATIEDVTIHTLRHSFGSIAAELGFSELTIAGLLGHSVPGITARYSHVPDMALCAAADRVSSRIAAALGNCGCSRWRNYGPGAWTWPRRS